MMLFKNETKFYEFLNFNDFCITESQIKQILNPFSFYNNYK
jgi:hypothetical protein